MGQKPFLDNTHGFLFKTKPGSWACCPGTRYCWKRADSWDQGPVGCSVAPEVIWTGWRGPSRSPGWRQRRKWTPRLHCCSTQSHPIVFCCPSEEWDDLTPTQGSGTDSLRMRWRRPLLQFTSKMPPKGHVQCPPSWSVSSGSVRGSQPSGWIACSDSSGQKSLTLCSRTLRLKDKWRTP